MPQEMELDESREKSDDLFFNKLKSEIKKALNFDTYQYSDNFLKRRITVRMNANNMKSYHEYYNLFINSPEEHELLKKNLTIHVTDFFRDQDLWDFCREDFFPHILNMFNEKREIRIWSAGCSSGQEAISILITFLEIDQNISKLKIICTDISQKILDKAKEAVYDDYEIKNIPKDILDKYFEKEDNLYRFKSNYRTFFDYKIHDVLQDKPLKGIDMLFFRNTVIYFSADSKSELYRKFHQELNDDSFLILGKTETLIGSSRDYFDVYNSYERIFSRKEF